MNKSKPGSETKPGPLDGIKVLDLSTVVLGPYAGQILGDLGAEVIRVESPFSDMTRWSGNPPNPGFGPMFMMCNRNKRSLCLDLKKDSARDALRRLIPTADVFLHNVRGEAMDRLGFGYEEVAKIKPDIVYVHAVGFGSDGPYAGQPAYDDIVQAAAGSASLNTLTNPDEEPRYVPTLAADKISGLHAAYATLAAIIHHERTGEGQFVEVPMLESFTSFLMIEHLNGHVYDPPRGDYGYHRVINYNRKPYQTKDGYVCIMPYSPDQWRTVLEAGGLDIPDDDPRLASRVALGAHFIELQADLNAIAPNRTTEDWIAVLREADVPVMRVNRIDELVDEPHLSAVDFFQRREGPGVGGYLSTKPPVKFAKSPASIRRDPPALGADNREVLLEVGLSDREIDALEAEGALASMLPE